MRRPGVFVGILILAIYCLGTTEVNGTVAYYALNPNCDRTAIVRQLLRLCTLRNKRNTPSYHIQPEPEGSNYYEAFPPPATYRTHATPYFQRPSEPYEFQIFEGWGYPPYAPPLSAYPPTPYFVYNQFTRPTTFATHFPDPFKRWRRNARFNEIVMRCCQSQCLNSDLLQLDSEFNICDK